MSDLSILRQPLAPFANFVGSSVEAAALLQKSIARSFPDVATALAETRADPLSGVALSSSMLAGGRVENCGARLIPASGDGIVAALLTAGAPIALDAREQRGELAQLLGLPGVVLALPLHGGREGQRFLLVGHANPTQFGLLDLPRLWTEVALVSAVLDERVASRHLAKNALREAGELSDLAEVQTLLQPMSPTIRGLDYAFHWQPASGAAGDYYDLMPLTWLAGPSYQNHYGDWWGVMVGDVSGHGPAAAMEAVQFDAILRTYKGDEPPGGPAGAVTYANRYFFSRRQRRCFMTVFGALYRAEEGKLDYCCAGHPSALLRRGDEIIKLGEGKDGDIPLGIVRDHGWSNRRIDFGPGDMLVVYTDGIVEAKNAAGEQYGLERLERAVRTGPLDATAMMSKLRLKVIAHQGGEIGIDDQTIVVLHQKSA